MAGSGALDVVPTDGALYKVTVVGSQQHSIVARLFPGPDEAHVHVQREGARPVAVPVSAVVAVTRLEAPRAVVESGTTRQAPLTSPAATACERIYKERVAGKGSHVSAQALLDLTRAVSVDQDIDRSVAAGLTRALEALAQQYLEEHYEKREAAHDLAHQALRDLAPVLEAHRQDVPAFMQEMVGQLNAACSEDHVRFHDQAKIQVDLLDVHDTQKVVVEKRTADLTLTIQTPTGTPPIEQVTLCLKPSRDAHAVGGLATVRVLRGGARRELTQQLKVSDLAVELGEVQVEVFFRYRRTNGSVEESSPKYIRLQLSSRTDFVSVKNPYSRYSGGNPVDDGKMFYGRSDLLSRLTEQLQGGAPGQCFVLYGQKRSGKSSVLQQLEQRLTAPVLTVNVSLGAIDTAESERSFIQLCIDGMYNQLVFGYEILDARRAAAWPSDKQVASAPMESFRRAVLATRRLMKGKPGFREPRIVLLVDEFSYIYEYITEGLVSPAFMRQWKALLQTRTFSAVVVGQDSMPDFKRAYPNEFGVSQDERLTYLDVDEARALADQPLRVTSGSRYRGGSLDRVLELTAGAPYYLQVVCDQVVRRLNRERSEFITDSLLERAVEDLLLGSNALTLDKFDPLITAAGESVAHVPRSEYLSLLQRLASLSATGPVPVGNLVRHEDEGRVLEDLLAREVVQLDRNRNCTIRVQLFARWLRANDVSVG